MQQFTKSLGSFTWAMSMFGVQQFGSAFSSGNGKPLDRAAASFDAVTQAAESTLSDVLKTGFHQGDTFQRESIGFVSSLVSGDAAGALTSGSQIVTPLIQAAKPLFAPVDPMLAAVDRIIPGADLEVRWQEFNNQLEIFLLVPSVPSKLGIKPRDDTPLSVLVERAYGLGGFLSVWSVEGLGKAYGQMAFEQRDPPPRDLLTDPTSLHIPASSLMMLNAGIGLAFAERELVTTRPSTPAAEVQEAVRRILTLDRENATPGYLGAAIESLGLVTNSFHPRLVQIINDQLEQIAPEVLGYYWHGVGRSHYFSPRNLMPCSEINWSTVADVAPNEHARRNFIAGLSWAVTLVNMRHPQIMASVLEGQGDVVSQNDAFVNGVVSSIIMRYDTTPGAAFIKAFCGYEVPPREPQLAELWDSQVRQTCSSALIRFYPVLKQRHVLGEIFQYHPLSKFPNLSGG